MLLQRLVLNSASFFAPLRKPIHLSALSRSALKNMALNELRSSKSFGGYQKIFSHYSEELSCQMQFAAYIPPQEKDNGKFPVLYWLPGLTNNEESFIQKGGAQKYAAKHGIVIICSDTSPRNVDIPGQDDDEIGYGAGFYLDATKTPWSKHYRMFSYVTKELVKVVESNLPVVPGKRSISGHSMGGHGALICALKNPGLYCSVSALEPVANVMKSKLGSKNLCTYLGDNEENWKEWDATEQVSLYKGPPLEIFIDQGTADEFYDDKELLPENFIEAAGTNKLIQAFLKFREGYDHSHYYIATVIKEHIEFHAKHLKA